MQMRRIALVIPVFALSLAACKKDELQAALDECSSKLAGTQKDLAAQKQANSELTAENQSLQAKIAELEGEIGQLNSQIADLAAKAGLTEKELADLRKEKAKREAELALYKKLFDSLKKLVNEGKIKVDFRKGRLVVKLDNSILFESGKTKLKEEGQSALAELSNSLKTVGDRDWLVAGHTDNVPIRTAKFKSNWELSTARAVEVVNFMLEQGFPSTHVGAAGFGEHDPVADNSSETGRAENRRIEIILMPKLGAIPGMKEMLTGRS